MPIRWKLVSQERKSIITVLGQRDNNQSKVKILTRDYPKDTIVTAHPKSMGLLVFAEEHQAKGFQNFFSQCHLKLLKVQGIGRGKRIKCVLVDTSCLWQLILFLNGEEEPKPDYSNANILNAPEGSMAYRSIKVLT